MGDTFREEREREREERRGEERWLTGGECRTGKDRHRKAKHGLAEEREEKSYINVTPSVVSALTLVKASCPNNSFPNVSGEICSVPSKLTLFEFGHLQWLDSTVWRCVEAHCISILHVCRSLCRAFKTTQNVNTSHRAYWV